MLGLAAVVGVIALAGSSPTGQPGTYVPPEYSASQPPIGQDHGYGRPEYLATPAPDAGAVAPANSPLWAWILGRDFSDPEVQAVLTSCGLQSIRQTVFKCQPQGWQIELRTSAKVGWVTLYNASPSGFRPYPESLPYGLSLSDTYDDVAAKLGQADLRGGGWGMPIDLTYRNLGPYVVKVTFTAIHDRPEEVGASSISDVAVSLPE